jgi:hypothetical protein
LLHYLRLHIVAKFASLCKQNKSQISRTESESDKKSASTNSFNRIKTGTKRYGRICVDN